tara:strand:- start:599 stop:790 length:192 start_codon:yes stop_codon:yes gene_type:complete
MITKDYLGYDCNLFEIVTDKLNKIWKGITGMVLSFGYARAAGELSRAGLHKEAKELILELTKR